MSAVFEIDPDRPADLALAVDRAAAAITAGRLVVLPTETVYGIAARPDDPAATERLFEAKRRPRDLNLPVLASAADEAWRIAEHGPAADRLAEAFWPGPLTLVLARTERARGWRLGEHPHSVGVRVPAHRVTVALLDRVGALAATSANLSGRPPLSDGASLAEAFGEAVAVYLVLAEGAPRPAGIPSTVVDLTTEEPLVLRPGAVGEEQIRNALR